ncbi:hypothetical protein AB0L53_04820 [Nonomuraea sp. NPDC052129]|uniref:hypothetical protein n=1 Tax=Nonomuraea sp. NPDC052129 TaxID=3154651 RepID=UPI0034479A78
MSMLDMSPYRPQLISGFTAAPGKFLISSPEHDIPRRARAYLLDDEGVQATAERHAEHRPPLDEVSAQALLRAAELPVMPSQSTVQRRPGMRVTAPCGRSRKP